MTVYVLKGAIKTIAHDVHFINSPEIIVELQLF